ncbi:hypothetical protein [Paenibacillus alvei]|uniref:hypothetical protein n=1 Tax=Paenibacillus alvei TaxID=44250 RepID=UPI002281E346|nr:hypothetical protein [Paenibacillus alvei]
MENQSSEKYKSFYSQYQKKNDSAFIYIIKHASETIPLADTLMEISESKENEDPTKIRQLIDKAKIQAEEVDEQLSTFIEFSDSYTNNAVPKHFINNAALTTDEQYNMFILAREARIWWPLYDISRSYWRSNPKVIDSKTRRTLRSLATELHELNKTITLFKDKAHDMFFQDQVESYKANILWQLKPHLEKLKKIIFDFSGRK